METSQGRRLAFLPGTILASLFFVLGLLSVAEPPKATDKPYAGRRARIQAAVGEGLALVPAAPASKKFRQDNDFYYLTGGDWPDAVLALTKEGAWLFHGEAHDALEPVAFFDPGPAGFTSVAPRARLGLAVGRYETDLRLMTGAEEYYSAPNVPGKPRDFAQPFVRAAERQKLARDLRREFPKARVKPLQQEVSRLRLVKDEGEIQLLKRAAKVTGDALSEAIARAKPGMREREFQRLVEQGYLDRGAEWIAFPTIVGSGRNGTVIHYTENLGKLGEGELVVCDTGAEIEHYASDVTRTFPAGGKFTKRQREVYETVLEAQLAGIRAVRPGETLLGIDAVARAVLNEKGFAGKMPHYTCHWVGLAVHDAGDYNAKLVPGMVLTVEPGIYLEDEGIGVRIEDVLLVTEDGAVNLTGWIPKTVEDLEKIAGSKAEK
ncbi:MAG: aminopeptidase P family protein [Planctomycetes bacterium]|nr:aminopeptidase P family protein [Planctomycetota bacterium]